MAHILFVDDEAAITDIGSQFLELYGFDVSTACTGQMALEVSSERHVDVLVTDFQMPGMNGQELIEHMREHQPDLPAIIVSGCADQLSTADSNTKIFVKTIKMGKLLETINDLLEDSEQDARWTSANARGNASANDRHC